MLKPLVLAVLAATLIQGVTSFTLTQLLSKEAQRLIAELRRKVQEHIGRLPVAYYDANKSRHAGFAHHERRGGRAQPASARAWWISWAASWLALFSLGVLLWISPRADAAGAGVHRRLRASSCARRSGASGRSSASAARSPPRSPGG